MRSRLNVGRRWMVWVGAVIGLLVAGSGWAADPPTLKIGGYLQSRFTFGLGDDAGDDRFLIRRSRITLDAEPNPVSKMKFEIDFGEGKAQMTHGYVDFTLPESLVGAQQAGNFRVRVGQCKVPLGVDVPRSSQRRLAMERVEVVRRANYDEYDQGLYLMYTPQNMKGLFKALEGNYGVGDYGMVTLGLINGQGRNLSEADNNKPIVFRIDYPFTVNLGGQERTAQIGLSGRYGKFTNAGGTLNNVNIPAATVNDTATVLHFFMPPEPWGLEGEWVIAGKGPAVNRARTAITTADRDGFGILASYKRKQNIVFLRYDEMNGWRKRPDRLPTDNEFDRLSLGYVHEISGRTRVTVEYDTIDRAGADEDELTVQWQLAF